MRVLGGEAQSEDPGPSDGELSQSETNSLPDLDRSVTEDNSFTETLSPAGLTSVPQDLTVLSMPAAELQWWLAATYQGSVFRLRTGVEGDKILTGQVLPLWPPQRIEGRARIALSLSHYLSSVVSHCDTGGGRGSVVRADCGGEI